MIAARAAAGAGAWGDVRATLERDESAATANGSRAMLLGEACLRTGDPRTAIRWLDFAEPLLTKAGNRPSLRSVVNLQGAAAFALGALARAEDRFAAAFHMAQLDADSLLTARATNNLGLIAALRGDADSAIASYQRAITAYQRMGHSQGLAESWHNLGISYRIRGELNAADDAELRAIEFATEATNPRLVAMAQVGRAEISLRRDDAAWARATAQRAASVFAALPDFLLQADALRVHADASDRLGLRDDADDSFARALELSRAHEHRTQLAQTLQTQAQTLARRGETARALAIGAAARDAFSQIGSVDAADEMAEFLAALAR